ncbi:hypothetical protein WG68_11110 [Arsukibacterium ikkense]|uniref:PRC-barrel domain-containing protein n=1 Tax=Arsukibacterium ikkense TaxID=336831 RepID=A0A0M2V7Y6_9GAMM|nr:PRC-barrel domain-containing protein [Arsukibacterium ikkense]KKO45268.1 hypothetical protein WG68_11110 [Arsukibacterium ikkense]
MKKLNSIIFYTLITPAISLATGSVLAEQSTTKNDQSTPRTSQAELQKQTDRKNMPGQAQVQKRGYIDTVPANGIQASNLIGADVRTSNNEDIGSVQDLIIDGNGQVVAIVVSVGGFLGMGEKDVAISWSNVTRSGSADDQQLRINATREDLTSATTFAKRD